MLKKFRNFTYQHAIPVSFILAFAFFWLVIGVNTLFSLVSDSLVSQYVRTIFAIIYPIGIAVLFGFKGTLPLKPKNFFKGLLIGLPFIFVQFIVLIDFFSTTADNPNAVWKPWYLIILSILSLIEIAVREEFIYRATIQNILAKKYAHSVKGIWITAIVSAVVFGSIHLCNIFAGLDPKVAIVQATTNIFVGLFFAAIYLRSKNIWTPVAIHALTDMAGLAKSKFLMHQSDIAVMGSLSWRSLIGGVLFAGLAIFLLRPSKCKALLSNLEADHKEKK